MAKIVASELRENDTEGYRIYVSVYKAFLKREASVGLDERELGLKAILEKILIEELEFCEPMLSYRPDLIYRVEELRQLFPDGRRSRK